MDVLPSDSAAFADGNRGPLTTYFKPPSSCLTETTMFSFDAGGSSSTQFFQNHYDWGDASCYPSTIATISGTEQWGNYYYSPGICPSGWSSACSQSIDPAGFSTTLQPATTAVLCCPLGWSCFEAGGWTAHGCTTPLTSGQVLTSVWAYVSGESYQQPFITPSEAPSLTSVTITSSTTALCDGIPVMWQNTDKEILSLLAIASSGSTTGIYNTALTSTSANLSPTSTTALAAATNPSSSALSVGAKAGIGISIPLVFLAIVLGIFLYFRRRKKRELQSHQDVSGALDEANAPEVRTHWEPHELPHKQDPYPQMVQHAEAPMAAYHGFPVEADSVSAIPELWSESQASRSPSELPASASSLSGNTNQVKRKSLAPSQKQSPLAESSTGPRAPSQSAASGASNDETKLRILQSRIDRVREEKERLTKLQVLEEMEKDLQKEILAEQRRTMGL